MAVDIFLKIDSVKGESSDSVHKDEIDVLAWNWGMNQSGSMHAGKGGGSGKVSVHDLSITHYIDKSAPALMQYCCSGKHLKEAKLVVRKAGGTPLEYLTIHLQEVLITSISPGGSSGEDKLTESFTLNFAKVKFTYKSQKADGTPDAPVDMAWNVRENTDKV